MIAAAMHLESMKKLKIDVLLFDQKDLVCNEKCLKKMGR